MSAKQGAPHSTIKLAPRDTIGILGGGQLARMLALAAASYGLKTHIYAPEEDSPAFEVSSTFTCAAYEDELALERFAKSVDVITYEFENVPLATASSVSRFAPLLPEAQALAVTQDRLFEKTRLQDLGLPVAPFLAVETPEQLEQALQTLKMPCILKTRRMGYDGKGQVRVSSREDLQAALNLLAHAPAILEGFIAFNREISVIGARSQEGEFVAYDVCENIHTHHILAQTTVPAQLLETTRQKAIDMAQSIAHSLNYVGILAVEMFVVRTPTGETLIINEMAPRVHNSGHWTLEGAQTSQFEQHIRAICGWPLGSPHLLGDVRMRNLVGDEAKTWESCLSDPYASLHLYGKADIREGRKMGHITWVMPPKSSSKPV
jgi:5-(carboxyamino)imidazole ribonucleotide synthase